MWTNVPTNWASGPSMSLAEWDGPEPPLTQLLKKGIKNKPLQSWMCRLVSCVWGWWCCPRCSGCPPCSRWSSAELLNWAWLMQAYLQNWSVNTIVLRSLFWDNRLIRCFFYSSLDVNNMRNVRVANECNRANSVHNGSRQDQSAGKRVRYAIKARYFVYITYLS